MEAAKKPTIHNFDVPPETVITRFVDAPRLFDLLIHGHLFFSPIKSLMEIDPYECFRPVISNEAQEHEQLLFRYAFSRWELAMKHLQSSLWRESEEECREKYLKRLQEMEPAELREFVSYLRRDEAANQWVCNCWHMGSEESDAMWRIYCQQNGVAIRSTVADLSRSLQMPTDHTPIFGDPVYEIAPVLYLKNDELAPKEYAERPWLIKRPAFSHEKELRVSYEYHGWRFSGGTHIGVEVPHLIREIVITPFLPSWAQQSVAKAVSDVLAQRDLTQIPVRISEHMNAPDELGRIINRPLHEFARAFFQNRKLQTQE